MAKTYENLHEPPTWRPVNKGTVETPKWVWDPNDTIRVEQDELRVELAWLGVEFEHATGGVWKSDILANATRHTANRYFFQVDLKNAYGQVDLKVLAYKLAKLGVQGTQEGLHERLVKYYQRPGDTGITKGGPAATDLFNLYCLDLDTELGAYCAEQGITYTRFVDDLTFSRPEADLYFPTREGIGIDRRRALREIIARHNLELNEAKTRVSDKANGPIIVTGMQLNPGGTVQFRTSVLKMARLQLGELVYTDAERARRLASGFYGLLNMTHDPQRRRLTEPEQELLEIAQDIILTHSTKFDH